MANEVAIIDRRMSSLEIAEITGKRHSDVMRDIRKQFEELEINERKFALTYSDAQGKERPMFNLDEEQTMILASGYKDSTGGNLQNA